MAMALKIERRGRKRKAGARHPGGQLVRGEKRNSKSYFYALLYEPVAVYVMECGPIVKIGRSGDPRKRTSNIQTGNGHPVRLFWFKWLRDTDAEKLETYLHRRHQGTSVHSMGEWYYMTPIFAVSLVEEAINELGLFALSDDISRRAA